MTMNEAIILASQSRTEYAEKLRRAADAHDSFVRSTNNARARDVARRMRSAADMVADRVEAGQLEAVSDLPLFDRVIAFGCACHVLGLGPAERKAIADAEDRRSTPTGV